MRTSDQIGKDIGELKEKIQALQNDVKLKADDLEHTKNVNARLLAEHAGRSKRPASIETQRTRIFELAMDVDQGRSALEILNGQLKALKEEDELVKLWQTHIPSYERAQEAYFQKLESIRAQFYRLSRVQNELQILLDEFLGLPNVSQPLASLGILASSVRDGDRITKDLQFPIFKELMRYRLLNDYLPFQGTVKTLLKSVDKFTDRLMGMEYNFVPTLERWLNPASSKGASVTPIKRENVAANNTHSTHTKIVQPKVDHQGRKVQPA